MSLPKLTVGSLFAGIGGIDLGLEMTGGFETVWQVENDEYATRVLEKHWPDVRRWGDVRAFLAYAKRPRTPQPQGSKQNKRRWSIYSREKWRADNHVDLICGGFPCQPVSCAGKQRGEHDERWLWDEMRRVCAILRPTWVLAENVLGLLSAKDVHGKRGALFGRVVQDLASLGYRVRWDCVPAASVGAPHIRDRVFIVAHTRSVGTGNATQTVQAGESQLGGKSDVADAECKRQSRRGEEVAGATEPPSRTEERNWWATEPDVGRVAHGVPKRVDRLRCLGNAVVPQVVQYIGERILAARGLNTSEARVNSE